MAIQGTIQIEDVIVHFGPELRPDSAWGEPETNRFFVRASQLGGANERVDVEAIVEGRDLMLVLGLALNWDAGVLKAEEAWAAADRVTAALNGLRICP